MGYFLIFVVLQCCDLITTLWFLSHGIREGNPLVAALIRLSSEPAVPLALLKGAACLLAYRAWRRNSLRLLGRVNLLFAAAVGWNLVAIARLFGA
jgi:hypothetical protein